MATVALRPPLRKMSTREPLSPVQWSETFVPLTEPLRVGVATGAGCGGGAAGGGGATEPEDERRIAPLVGPSVTEVVEEPSSRSTAARAAPSPSRWSG